jgi:hypothetical protein
LTDIYSGLGGYIRILAKNLSLWLQVLYCQEKPSVFPPPIDVLTEIKTNQFGEISFPPFLSFSFGTFLQQARGEIYIEQGCWLTDCATILSLIAHSLLI